MPSFQLIYNFLSEPDKRLLANAGIHAYNLRHCTISTAMRDCHAIKCVTWKNAILRATLSALNEQNAVESEVYAAAGPAYLAMGNTLFRVEATDFIQTGERALSALRAKIKEDATQEARVTVLRAEEKANTIIVKAQKEAQHIASSLSTSRTELARLRVEASELGAVPSWLRTSHYSIQWRYAYVSEVSQHSNDTVIRCLVPITIKEFYATNHAGISATRGPVKHVWRVSRPKALQVPIGIPINPLTGDYGLRQIITLDNWGNLPHISSDQACMTLGDAPTAITSTHSLNRLLEGIKRTFQYVNLDSPLIPCHSWHVYVKRMIPRSLRKCFEDGASYFEVDCTEKVQLAPELPLDFEVVVPVDQL